MPKAPSLGRGLALLSMKTNSQTSVRGCKRHWASHTDSLLDETRTDEDAEGSYSHWVIQCCPHNCLWCWDTSHSSRASPDTILPRHELFPRHKVQADVRWYVI